MKMMTTRLRITPRLIIDVRDWYRQVFVSAQQLEDELKPGVVRPTGSVRIFAEGIEGDNSWPFAGLSELPVQRSDNGVLSFHGRVQRVLSPIIAMSTASTLLGPALRLNQDARCRLTILTQAFQPVVIDSITLHEPIGEDPGPTPQLIIGLMPGVLYNFPSTATAPTLLTGQIVRDAQPLFGAKTKVLSPPVGSAPPRATEAVFTDTSGKFLLVLDAIDPSLPPAFIQRPLSPTVLQIEYQGVQKLVSAPVVAGQRNWLKPIEI